MGYDLAELEDFGGKFEVTDEERTRNQTDVVDQRTTQLANSILRSLDRRALAAVDAALDGLDGGVGVVFGSNWSAIERNGDPTSQTPTPDRFEANLADVQLAFDIDDLGLTFDTLVMNPTQKAAVATAYGKDLADVLAAFETKIVASGGRRSFSRTSFPRSRRTTRTRSRRSPDWRADRERARDQQAGFRRGRGRAGHPRT
ncbi:hypothetical protein ERC79_01315 [Rhodococcus sp. ABRD24]|nr:major capsid protein [Rhodococcus sp. ABRD24]QBJ94753.1 hypothetical protein ERC79_01315 [Rhodococcus sp. ABRD24]